MQKKIIALAVAGLVSGGAFAQSNVTIYGVLDVNVNWMNTGFGSKMAVGSGGLSASRLGFKGEEGLGNGMKAVWALEAGLSMDTQSVGGGAPALGINNATPSTAGATGAGGQFFARQGFVGLEGSWGHLSAGREYTGSYIGLATIIDPVVGGLYANASNIGGGGLPTRVNNGIVYKTPSMNGFSAWVTYTTGAENNISADTVGAAATNDKAGRGWDIAGFYRNGPLNVMLSTWNVNNNTYNQVAGETGLADRTGWALGGNYDFKVVKLHLGYIASKINGGNYENITSVLSSSTGVLGALAIPVGANGKVVLNAQSFNDKSRLDRDSTAYSMSYLHEMSKRTTLYGSYGKLDNNQNAMYSMVSAGDIVGAVTVAGQDVTALMFGLRHSF